MVVVLIQLNLIVAILVDSLDAAKKNMNKKKMETVVSNWRRYRKLKRSYYRHAYSNLSTIQIPSSSQDSQKKRQVSLSPSLSLSLSLSLSCKLNC